MILDSDIRAQLNEYFKLLEGDVLIKVSTGSDEVSKDMKELVYEVASMSDKIKLEEAVLDRTPSFSISRMTEDIGITFAGIPLGHEFTSFVLALLQVSGRPPKIDEGTAKHIASIKDELKFETYVSLSCNNCPEVVQALNIMSVLNPNISHTMIDGSVYRKEVESKDILAVPTVYLNGEFFASGRMTVEDILEKLDIGPDISEYENKEPFDVLVIGGGPAGASAAIYAARKGIRTGIVADRFGGQVNETLSIENYIGIKNTEGSKLAADLEGHVRDYDVDIMVPAKVKNVTKEDLIHVELENGGLLKSKTLIIATGARWRNIGVPGEEEYKNKGVAYCPHCDGPLFKDKHVAVIGGGNSGIEAAIDLAGIASKVTVLEFLPELKADKILREKVYSLTNVDVLTNVETKEITGDKRVNGISYTNRDTGDKNHIHLDGVFVQIGLVPNTEWVADLVERNQRGEILVDKAGATNVPGIFAAGDCTDSLYKQIVVSMGAGASAALSAFDYLIRN
ncbi:MAG: alkyl hydroperoxide reductase subunit F [Clostridiales bacterium]|nr:alkyl hydroperoxide reductase subunit F [Clostridiales bacterium]